MTTHELMDKVGKMICDYLQFECEEGDTEIHAADARRQDLSHLHEVHRQSAVEPKAQAGKGMDRQAYDKHIKLL